MMIYYKIFYGGNQLIITWILKNKPLERHNAFAHSTFVKKIIKKDIYKLLSKVALKRWGKIDIYTVKIKTQNIKSNAVLNKIM